MEGASGEPPKQADNDESHRESEPLVELLGQAERLRKIRDLGVITREQYGELLNQLLTRF